MIKSLFSMRLWLVVAFSVLPDLDAAFGLVFNDMARFHNNISHSLALGLLVGLVAGVAAWLLRRSGFVYWFSLATFSYWLHVIMDAFTYDTRGVMLLWPLTDQRFEGPVKLFYGVRWSEGWIAVEHLWTLFSEIGFIALLFLGWWLFIGRNRPGRSQETTPAD